MCQLVILVVSLLVEALAAELASKGLESRVDSRMRVESRAAVEGLATGMTGMRLLLGVDDFMPGKVV